MHGRGLALAKRGWGGMGKLTSHEAAPKAPLWQVAVVLLLVQTFFAGNGLLVKLTMNGGTDPVVFAFWRDVLASPVLLMLARTPQLGPWRRPSGQGDFVQLALLGLTGVVGAQMLTPLALQYVEPTTFSVFQLMLPVVTPFLSAGLSLESGQGGDGRRMPTLSPDRILGLGLCVFGAGADLLSKAGMQGQWIGFALLTVQVLASAFFHLLIKRSLQSGWPPTALIAWSYTVGTLELGLVLILVRPPTLVVSRSAAAVLVYAVVLTSVFNYIGMAWANRQLGPTAVTAFFPLQVVLSTFLQPAVGLPKPSIMDWASAVVVCLGLGIFMNGEGHGEKDPKDGVLPKTVGAEDCTEDERLHLKS